jgi:hypothetical protein
VQGHPAELVFNLDEVGISEWENRKIKKVIVLVSARDQTIHQKINRALKHVSVIAYVSTAGENFTPYIVTSQDSAKLREQLNKCGIHFGIDLILKRRAKPYINTESFGEDIHTVFMPNLNDL